MDENVKEKKGLNISAKSFITAILVILVLMIGSYILTVFLPGGEYSRTIDASGNTVIDTDAGFSNVDGGIPFWKWILSPFLVLGANGKADTTLIAVIAFILVVGGIFNSLDKSGVMKYMLDKIVHRFGNKRYTLMAIVILFFMALGSLIGSFEEVVPLVPIVVALAISLGWDALTGLSMSLLAIGCGFAAGVCNPFTVGVAQKVSGLPMFSGIWLRAVALVLIYFLLLFFTRHHAKKIEKPLDETSAVQNFTSNRKMDNALIVFCVILGTGIAIILSSIFIKALQDYTMIVVAVMFLIAGISSTLISGAGFEKLMQTFGNGVLSILPAVIMILMASSIKYTLEEAKVLDTILHFAVDLAGEMPKGVLILFIYLIVLIMNFLISSGSAKAILLMPLITPLAQLFNISTQLCVVAFAFGDGFSNVFYPTNPVLLISLGLVGISYIDWVKHSWKFQIANLVLTSGLLLFGLVVGYH